MLAAGDVATAAAWNVLTNDVIDTRAVLANVKSTTLTTTTTTTVTTAGTFYDISGLTISITPTSATSKIMIWAQIYGGLGTDNVLGVRLVRDSTPIGIATAVSARQAGSTGAYYGSAAMTTTPSHFPLPMQFLDSPATTSALTYKVQVSSNTNGTVVYINRSNNDGDSPAQVRATSTITVMEVPV